MKQLVILAVFAAVFAATPLLAQKQQCYVVENNGAQTKALSIKADANGTLEIVIKKDTPPVKRPRGQYRYAVIPRPPQVERYVKLFEDRNYGDMLKAAPGLYTATRYVGWGDLIAAYQSEALLDQGKVEEARQALKQAQAAPGANKDAVLHANVRLLVHDKKFADVENLLKQLMTSKEDKTAAFAFNTRGQVLAAQGQKREAVLEYLKTLLLFDGKKTRAERAEAKRQAVALMTELKDPRVSKIKEMD